MIKIDWLSFVYKATDDEKATYKNIFTAFLSHFPNIEKILDETVVVSHGRTYYTSAVCWNDGIQIAWDDEPTTEDFYLFNGKKLEPWEHGVYVSIPAHGLHYLNDLLELETPFVEDSYLDIVPVFQELKKHNCTLSRLDIAFDDTSKRFYPRDFHKLWDNLQVQSPCHSYSFCGGSGSTFYVGCRANKILRIYDKEVESRGDNKSIRYEIETHHRYANDIMNMILEGNFNFFECLQKWFIRLKVSSTCDSLNDKSRLSSLPDLPEWVEFINLQNVGFANTHCVFPVHSVDVNMDKKRVWLRRQVAKTLVMFIKSDGIDSLYSMLDDVDLRPVDVKIIEDSIRINEISRDMYKRRCSKFDIMRRINDEINKALPC